MLIKLEAWRGQKNKARHSRRRRLEGDEVERDGV